MDNLFSFLSETLSVSEVVSVYNIYASNDPYKLLYGIEELDEVCADFSVIETVIEIADMVVYDNFSLNSIFFTFDGPGNLESVNENEALEYIENNVDTAEFYTKLIEHKFINPDDYDEWKQENE